jgi:hypothetical protein
MTDLRTAGGRFDQSKLPDVRRSRLIIPLFAAAAATYIALVREDGMIRRRRTTPLPAGPATADVPDPSRPVMQPPPMPSAPVYTPKPTTVVSPVVAPTPDAETVEPPSTGVETASVASSPEVDTPPEPIEAVTEPVPAPSLDVAPIAVPAPTPVDVFERHIAPSPPPDAADETAPVEWTEMEGLPDLPAAAQGAAAAGAVAPEGPVLDEGTFSIGGWAAAPGHSVVSAVTYHHRLPASVDADRIVLHIESAENIPDDGLVVLSDPGFAPDREGFTLLLGAAAPGPFSAAGTYRAVG